MPTPTRVNWNFAAIVIIILLVGGGLAVWATSTPASTSSMLPDLRPTSHPQLLGERPTPTPTPLVTKVEKTIMPQFVVSTPRPEPTPCQACQERAERYKQAVRAGFSNSEMRPIE